MRVVVWLVVQVALFQFVASVALLNLFASRVASAFQIYPAGSDLRLFPRSPQKRCAFLLTAIGGGGGR